MTSTKPIVLSKEIVWKAYKRVKANKGAAGIDKQSMSNFEEDLSKNLYKIWNRMASGSYFPPSVKQVPIPKKGGNGVRNLSVPTVSDRIAQTVVKLLIEPRLESLFHPDSYGYRPKKSAIDAVKITRKRCWKYPWIVEFDIKKAFDSLDWTLLLKAVRKHVPENWIVMYIERWLGATIVSPAGEKFTPTAGVPQGSVIGPLLMNLFMHYAFDHWMASNHTAPFARYADDAVIHCSSQKHAEFIFDKLEQRFKACHLELHPEKSKIVYCKDSNRKAKWAQTQFTFLGYTFRPRSAKIQDEEAIFTSFQPAVSNEALKAMRSKIRAAKLHRRTDLDLQQIGEWWNPILRGWWQYYGSCYKSEMYKLFRYFHGKLIKWLNRKYIRNKFSVKRRHEWLIRVADADPQLLYSMTICRHAMVV